MKKLKYLLIMVIFAASLTACAEPVKEVSADEPAETAIGSSYKTYKYIEYGYEISYPETYGASISGGHSPAANPEFGMRLSLSSPDSPAALDIDSIDKAGFEEKYQNSEDFIKYKKLKVKLDEEIMENDSKIKIYRLEDDDYYFSFFENEKYIFQLSSGSKDLLKDMAATFKFI